LAPGANVEPAKPGLYWSESARFPPVVVAISLPGTTVRATKASGAMSVGEAGTGGGVAGKPAAGTAGAGAVGAEGLIGLGVVTTMPGSCVCAWGATLPAAQAMKAAQGARNLVRLLEIHKSVPATVYLP
jgi:hypothetical protein